MAVLLTWAIFTWLPGNIPAKAKLDSTTSRTKFPSSGKDLIPFGCNATKSSHVHARCNSICKACEVGFLPACLF